ncbi:hypothetical protein [Lactobacillus gallinarum]|uniref:hypothetical protein n=1 Tax=Lactobacillus gallinarum TaxID=52242 RepID=UPI0024B256D5|nr:hypothetical protein [Lactobacillus gallinarum]
MLNDELSAEMGDYLTAGILKKYNEHLLSAVQRVFPELDIAEVQSLDDMNRNALGERAVVHAIARDKQRNKYGLIIQVGSQREGENILEIANGYQEEIIFGRLGGCPENEFKASYVVFFCREDPFGKGKFHYEYFGGKYDKRTGKTTPAPNVIFFNLDNEDEEIF